MTQGDDDDDEEEEDDDDDDDDDGANAKIADVIIPVGPVVDSCTMLLHGHCCRAVLWDTLAGHPCGTLL